MPCTTESKQPGPPFDTYTSREHDDLESLPVQLQLLHDGLAYPACTACHSHDMMLLLLQLLVWHFLFASLLEKIPLRALGENWYYSGCLSSRGKSSVVTHTATNVYESKVGSPIWIMRKPDPFHFVFASEPHAIPTEAPPHSD